MHLLTFTDAQTGQLKATSQGQWDSWRKQRGMWKVRSYSSSSSSSSSQQTGMRAEEEIHKRLTGSVPFNLIPENEPISPKLQSHNCPGCVCANQGNISVYVHSAVQCPGPLPNTAGPSVCADWQQGCFPAYSQLVKSQGILLHRSRNSQHRSRNSNTLLIKPEHFPN